MIRASEDVDFESGLSYYVATTSLSAEERLFRAMREILDGRGYEALTIRNVCKEANCSTSTFYRYFNDKYELLNASVLRGSEKLQSNSERIFKMGDSLHMIVFTSLYTAAYLETQDIEFLRSYCTPGNAALNPEIVGSFKQGNWIVRDYLSFFHSARAEGLFLDGVDIETIRYQQNVIYYGCLFERAIYGDDVKLVEPMREMLVANLNKFVKDEYKLPADEAHWNNWTRSFAD